MAETKDFKSKLMFTIGIASLGIAVGILSYIAYSAHSDNSKIEFSEALGSNIELCYEAMESIDPEAKIIAIKSSGYASATHVPQWMYLCASQTKACSYTVSFYEDQQPSAHEYGRTSFNDEMFLEIPAIETIQIDANEAFRTAYKSLNTSKEIGSCSAFLITYNPKSSEKNEAPALAWCFTFNDPMDLKSEGINDPSVYLDRTTVYIDSITGEIIH